MNKKIDLKKRLTELVFLGPGIFFFLMIVIVPFFMGIYYSMTSWNGVSDKINFVGLSNYVKVFHDEKFLSAFAFTFRYTVVNVILVNIVAFGLAVLLSARLKTKNILRTIFFLPNVLSGLLLGFIWQFIFIKGFSVIGEMTKIGFFELPWLGTPNTGFWGTVIVSVWQLSGYLMVIYIAGLTNVPQELIEACKIDGASNLQVLKNIILPMIMPAVTVCLFLSIANSFKIFDLNFSLTHGAFDTTSVAFDVYMEAFTNNNFGLGSAKAMIFCIVVAAISVSQVMITKRKEVEA
jgi:raffinose/stachyose/melibiose transport system permease protein